MTSLFVWFEVSALFSQSKVIRPALNNGQVLHPVSCYITPTPHTHTRACVHTHAHTNTHTNTPFLSINTLLPVLCHCCFFPGLCLHPGQWVLSYLTALSLHLCFHEWSSSLSSLFSHHFGGILQHSKLDLVLFDDIGEFSSPDEAVVWRDEQETIPTVQGGRSGLHQSGLNVPSACWYMGRKKHTRRQVAY